MSGELESDAPGAIAILGVNAAGQEGGNAVAVKERTIPWLQDTPEVDAWGSWHVTWRDVVVLDQKNDVRAVFNLTEHDLNNPDNYQALKQLLQDAR